MKRVFLYDLETTGVLCRPGLNPYTNKIQEAPNAIHQIAIRIIIDDVIDSVYNFKIKPFPGAVIDPKALEVGGIKDSDFLTDAYKDERIVYNELIEILQKKYKINPYEKAKTNKFHLAGFNIRSFDDHFFREFFRRNHRDKFGNLDGKDYFGSWFWSDSIDALVLASNYLQNERGKIEEFNLKAVAEALGIKVDAAQTHEGSYDVHLTHEILKILGNAPKTAEVHVKLKLEDLIALVRGVYPAECERNNKIFDGFGMYSLGKADWIWEKRKAFEKCEKIQLWNMYQVCKESFKKQKQLIK
jgi:DNA polymerase-3 subunit epsilon